MAILELDKKGDKENPRPESQAGSSSATLTTTSHTNDPFDTSGDASGGPDENRPLSSSIGLTGLPRDLERALIGSLTTSYKFKKDGLVKKTISNGNLHLM